jgi:hypothetical protein
VGMPGFLPGRVVGADLLGLTQLWGRPPQGATRRAPSDQPLPQNRAGNSHQPTRWRERQMQRFKSPEKAEVPLRVHHHLRPLPPTPSSDRCR